MKISNQNPYPAKISDVLTDDYSKAGKKTKTLFKTICSQYVDKKNSGATDEELRQFWLSNLDKYVSEITINN